MSKRSIMLPMLVALVGAGIGFWAMATPARGQVALEPLTITKTAADGENFLPGSTAYYQIEVCNPNDVTIELIQITDTLPSGFSYDSEFNSTSGLANFHPDVSGQTLTWLFDGESVGGTQCSDLNFSVEISPDEPVGMYCNQATVDWGAGTASTGLTAAIQVLNEGDTQQTPSCPGGARVRTATPTASATSPATETPVPATATPAPPTATQPAGGSEGVISAPNTGSGPDAGGPSILLLVLAAAMVAGGAGAAATGARRR